MRIPMERGADSRPTHLRRSELDRPVLDAYDGVYAASFRYPGFSLDATLARRGYGFVEEMLNLAACRAPFNLKRYAVLQDGWSIESPITDPEAADAPAAAKLAAEVSDALSNIRDEETDAATDLRCVLFDMMMGAWTGFRLAEIGWRVCSEGDLRGKHGFRGFWVKPNKQIGFDLDTRTLAVKNITSYTPGGGYDFDIPVEKCLLYTHNMSAGAPQGTGDWRACYKHWMRLEANLKFWALALERWGAPVLLLTCPAGSRAEMEAAQDMMEKIRNGSPTVLPDNLTCEVLSAPRSVFVGLERAAIWDTQQIALNINSNILTTSAGVNSLALGKVHADSGATVYDALSHDIEEAFTQQVIRRFVRYNYGDRALALCPRLRLRKQPEGDRLKIAQMLSLLIAGGNMPGRSRVIREQLGLPPLDPEEERLLEVERKAQQEARSRIADARNSGEAPPLSDAEYSAALERVTRAVFARETV